MRIGFFTGLTASTLASGLARVPEVFQRLLFMLGRALDETLVVSTAASQTPAGQHPDFWTQRFHAVRRGELLTVICHHSLEHIVEIDRRFRRVLKREAGSTSRFRTGMGSVTPFLPVLCSEGGGHVNRFRREQKWSA